MVTDPVCGTMIDPDDCHYFSMHEGESYGFCCRGCMERFDANPSLFLGIPAPALDMPLGVTGLDDDLLGMPSRRAYGGTVGTL